MVGVPFVYHDPDAFQFILVIPEGAEGRELSERAKLLERLRTEPTEGVPSYVRHFTVAYGHDGLAELIDESRPPETRELEPVDHDAGHLPNAMFVNHLATDLVALVADDELWLFVRLEQSSWGSFTEATSKLRVRLETIDQVPVCILSLFDASSDETRRAYLNPNRVADAPVLEVLARDSSATVVGFDHEGSLVRAFRVDAPVATNARLILERTEDAPPVLPETWAAAVNTARASADVQDEPHPFEPRASEISARDALDRLRLLEKWNAPDRIDYAVLQLGVPEPVVEVSRREILGDAVKYGLAMSDALLREAVRLGLAESSDSLLLRMVASFDEMVASTSEHGLDEAELEANRTALRRLCELHGTSTGEDQSCTMEHSG
jgi:hypothetical protein